jgi:hypothetical protein
MLKNIGLWVLAFLFMAAAAIYQRTTGPTYPVDGTSEVAGHVVKYQFNRSHGGEGDQKVVVEIGNAPVSGVLFYKRYNFPEEFTAQTMQVVGDSLVGYLPHQPPAGKLEYYTELNSAGIVKPIPGSRAIVTRFKGDVPLLALLPHILLMFVGLMFSTRTALEAMRPQGKTKTLTLWTVIIMFIGGMILGPVVQKYAFGAFWTGIPFGWDLTDNKTVIFVIAWIVALIRHRYHPFPRFWILAAALLVIITYLIPHSTMGSELDYISGEVQTG